MVRAIVSDVVTHLKVMKVSKIIIRDTNDTYANHNEKYINNNEHGNNSNPFVHVFIAHCLR